ncbi:uncharacterized protein LOC143911564 [Arctopsyche grandis]|uniref:uncharacterized protein LOC143911564 n=1 Tax=Arctopsyche grandis TaxID=121162 RepID=UPI00406D9FA9
MPSKRDPCLLAKPEVQHDFLARDVEELVCEIKENLRLKARPRRTQVRAAPYSTERPPPAPPTAPAPPEDPYEMLQQLLDTNCLVAEAVRRLREGLCPKRHFLYEDEEETLLYPLSY